MPRDGSIEVSNVAGMVSYHFTDLGLIQLKSLTVLGTPISDLAEYFQVSENWMRKQLDAVSAVKAAAQEGAAEGKMELRQALHDQAKAGDARVLTFLGERRLKMNKVVEHEHTHAIKVIGSQPEKSLQAGDWFKKFAPGSVQDADIIEDDAPLGIEHGKPDSADSVHKTTQSEERARRDDRPADDGGNE